MPGFALMADGSKRRVRRVNVLNAAAEFDRRENGLTYVRSPLAVEEGISATAIQPQATPAPLVDPDRPISWSPSGQKIAQLHSHGCF